MLYTVMPLELVFEETKEAPYAYEEIGLKNCTLQVYVRDKAYVVRGVVSSDPRIYLDQTYQPGTTISQSKLAEIQANQNR